MDLQNGCDKRISFYYTQTIEECHILLRGIALKAASLSSVDFKILRKTDFIEFLEGKWSLETTLHRLGHKKNLDSFMRDLKNEVKMFIATLDNMSLVSKEDKGNFDSFIADVESCGHDIEYVLGVARNLKTGNVYISDKEDKERVKLLSEEIKRVKEQLSEEKNNNLLLSQRLERTKKENENAVKIVRAINIAKSFLLDGNIADILNDVDANTIKSTPDILKKRVADIGMSYRLWHCLEANGVVYMWQIVRMNKSEFLKMRNMGRKALREMDEFLLSKNLSWGMDLSKYDDLPTK